MRSQTQQQGQPARKDRLIREQVHDTYKSKRKLPEPTVCPTCRAVFRDGRWQWASPPAGAHAHTCPACQRIHDKYPAGSVHLSGGFFAAHRQEILNLARNEETRAQADHPLKRIMAIEEQSDGVLITTTDPHLARAIGEALHRACNGEMDLQYAEESSAVRISWRRD